MWFLLLYMHISAVQGFNVSLRGSESVCRGRLEVHDGKGPSGLVCHHGWIKENGAVVCKSIGCGAHVSSDADMTRYEDPTPRRYLMDHVKCTSKENSLWSCPFVGEENMKCPEASVVEVHCSGDVKLSLNLNNQTDKCAGVVEFSTHGGTVGVCDSYWNANNADKICQELKCGNHYYIPKPGVFKENPSQRNVLFNCAENMKFSWQCMEWSTDCPNRASVICTDHRKFRLQNGSNLCSGFVEVFDITSKLWNLPPNNVSPDVICAQMNCGASGYFTNNTLQLTCAVNVTLLNFTSKCFGEVFFLVNGSARGVCYSGLDETQRRNLGTVVCRELGCGEMLDVVESSDISDGLLNNVDCQGDESSLWHCLARHEHNRCKMTRVLCSESLDVRLSDGLGRCSGRVEVKWKGSWKSFRTSDWSTKTSDVVCKHLGCGASVQMSKELFVDGQLSSLDFWDINCQKSSAKLHECFKKKTSFNPLYERQQKIICQEEQLLFFGGDKPCRGTVRIKTFNVSGPVGENKKNASDICREMQCGRLLSFNANTSYASCSGSVSVKLRNKLKEKCWGMVEVCRDGKCERVCRKTWTTKDSEKICKDLGCGVPVPDQFSDQTIDFSPVGVYSVYCSDEQQNMSMCNFIPNKHSACQDPAQVICTGSIKAKLEDPRDKCAGKVSLFLAGRWTPVCSDSTNKKLENAVCKELECGESDSSTSYDEAAITGLSGINCKQDFDSVSQCEFGGISTKRQCYAGYLTCQGWKRLLLYKNNNKNGSCVGPVYMYSQKEALLVTYPQGWGREEGQKMCKYLQCGNYTGHSEQNIPIDSIKSWNKTYNCSWQEKMWECEGQDQPAKTQLNIKCDGNSLVTLSNICTGEVLRNKEHVCASQWTDQMSDVLCDSLNCGSAIQHWGTRVPLTDHWHFSCTNKETLMWQCSQKKVQCTKRLSVACQNSVEFSTTKKCGGKLVVKYKGQWEYVCGKLTDTEMKEVCGALKCKDNAKMPVDEKKIATSISVTFKCPEKKYNISQCIRFVKDNSCTGKPAEVTCDGYFDDTGDSSVSLIVGLILGILGLLVLVFMWINRKRLILALRNYRNKNGKDKKTNGNEMDHIKTEDRDQDDYQDVDSLVNKPGEEDEDDRSNGSSETEYDDIEGQDNGSSSPQTFLDLPLLPKRSENILADQDTYEVETETKDDYDDAVPFQDASRENVETADTEARVDVDEKPDSETGTDVNVDAVMVATEAEIHAQPNQ